MKKIIVVDDKLPSKTTLAYWLKQEIEELTNGEYGVELLEGVIIAESLPRIREVAQQIRSQKDTLAGILIDLADRGVPLAGASLLDKVKSDPELERVDVVIYSSKYMPFSTADLRRRGAKAVVRRKVTGGRAGDLGKQILDAFEIPYSGGTNSTGPKHDE